MSNETREYGPREKITCNLPHGDRQRWPGRNADLVLHDLETALCIAFGGYTAMASVGGWIPGKHQQATHETGTCYSVSYPPDNESRQTAIALFEEAGERLGEEWIHIERSDFQAEHRRTSNGAGEYNNSLVMPDDEPSDKPPHDKPEAHNRDTCPRCILNGKASGGRLNHAADNIERIRQLDKETRDHINSSARSTDHARR